MRLGKRALRRDDVFRPGMRTPKCLDSGERERLDAYMVVTDGIRG